MPPNKAYKAKKEARRAEVAKLLRAAIPVYRIAEKLEIDRRTATADVNWLLAEWAKEQRPEDRHQWRALELAKLDEIEIKVAANARAGHEGAIDRVLKVMERRAKFMGLDAPTKQEVTGKDGGPVATVATVVILPDNGRNDRDQATALPDAPAVEPG